MMREFMRDNKILATFVLFMAMFLIMMITRPAFVFNRDGSIKDFGLGYTNRTVLPVWILVIIFAVMSYFIVSLF